MSEKNIQSMIMLALSQQGHLAFRNNVGNGVCGSHITRIEKAGPVYLQPGDWVVKNGRRVQFGLCPDSSDVVAVVKKIVTPAMVGSTVGLFGGFEVKTPTGRATQGQTNWLTAIRNAGGLAGVVRSPDEAVAVCNPLMGVE